MNLINEVTSDEQLHARVESFTMKSGRKGSFEVVVNDELIFSKLATDRHATEGELYPLLKEKAGLYI